MHTGTLVIKFLLIWNSGILSVTLQASLSL